MHEGEELQHDISKLWDQVQQISLSQRETKDELKGDMDVLKRDMDGLKWDMDGLKGVMDGIKGNMEAFKVDMNARNAKLEGLKTLLQERIPDSDKVIHENHYEDKRNMNYYFRDSNVEFKKHHIPNIYMRKFDGKDLVTWILQMEQYFDLQDVQPS